MATAKEAQAVKSLNLNPGRRNRRFVFKSVAERIEEIDIDVFRSLDPVKPEPVSGSFILDCLLEWRELNTAEDFISFYKEAMPLVQTYPLVLLHKELLMSKLLSRLQTKARLSLEPILRLIAELSRDLQEDFFIFLPDLVKSLLALLKSGADREPDTIKQIFTSWSYIMMYLRNPSLDVVHILKVTLKFRYYPKDYIEELMAKSLSFLLRNTSIQQLEKGIKKIVCEVARKPTHVRKFGASALMYHVLRGTSSHLHSRAEQMFLFFIEDTTFKYAEKFTQGPYVVVELVIGALQRIMESNPEGLKLLQDCLYREIRDCATRGSFQHLTHLLEVLISTVSAEKGCKSCDHKQLLEHIILLHKMFFIPTSDGKVDDLSTEIADKILQLTLCTLDGVHSSCDFLSISDINLQWAPPFMLENLRFRSSLVTFLKEFVRKDPDVLSAFRNNFFSSVRHLMETSPVEATYLVLAFIERLGFKAESSDILEGISEEVVSRICQYFQGKVSYFIELMKERNSRFASRDQLDEAEVALLWGIVCCYPYFVHGEGNASYLSDLVNAVDQYLSVESGDIAAGPSMVIFESIIGTALRSYHKLTMSHINELEHTSRVLSLAKKERYRSSSQILSAVADYLNSRSGRATSASSPSMMKRPKLEDIKVMEAMKIFEKNLCNADRGIRISTLRLLSYYEPLTCEILTSEHSITQYMKPEDSNDLQTNREYCNVIELLLSIEETTISITTSKKLTLSVSKIQNTVSTGRLPEAYISVLLHGIIGLFYNHFTDLSNSALECLSILLDKYSGLVWDRFVNIFEQCLRNVLNDHSEDCGTNDKLLNYSNDLLEHFHMMCRTSFCSRPHTSILVCFLQALQRIPRISESRSHQIVPLFLRFMGYKDVHPFSVRLFNPQSSKVRGYKGVLLEWLSLLRSMRNARSIYCSQFLRDVLTIRLLDENDSDIQIKVLDCLLNWKDECLAPYGEHMKNLISSKTFREELTTWSLSKESNLIEEGHREELVPFIIRLLMPKVRNLKTLASRKHASMSNRKAVLGFVAQLDFDELPLFFAMLIKPLLVKEHDSDPTSESFWCSVGITIKDIQLIDFWKLLTTENLLALPWKKRYGFLHVIEDILGIFNQFQIRPFLDLLSGCVVRILGSCATTLISGDHVLVPNLPIFDKDADASTLAVKQLKDLRSLCLRIISVILNKYEDHEFETEFWDIFFASVKPLIDGFKQEGSTSGKPSSLFSCFLAMSRSRNLVSLLCRERNLVQDIFLLLSVPKASEAVRNCVLNFTENLLDLDMELGDANNGARKALLPNLKALLDSLCLLFHSNHDRKRKLVKHPEETILRVLKLLSKFMGNPAEAEKFLDILLLLLQSGMKKADVCLEVLLVLEEVMPMLEVTCTAKILKVLSPLFVHAGLETRLSICKLLTFLAENDSSLFSTAKLLTGLNATSAMEMDELDYDTITMAYDRISVEYFSSVREDHILLVLSQLIHDMSSKELILSQNAYRSLQCFVEFSAKIIQQEEHQDVHDVIMNFGEDSWTKAGIQRVVNKFFLRHMGEAMNEGKDVQKVWIDLLYEMASKLSELPNLKALKALSSQDVEVDFFNNLLHIQKHRRARALLRFTNVARERKLPEVILKRVFMPLFFNMLFDLKDGGEEHLRSACLDALASVSSQMQWKSYYAFLMKCFRDMVKRPDKKRIFLRLICSILDQFHFFEVSVTRDSSISIHSAVDIGTVGRVPSVVSEKWASGATISEIQSCLKAVLQKLQKLRVPESEKVNVHISLAALKVLKLLPADVMDSHLLNVIQHITRLLKHRLESVRDEARAVLSACLKEIGFAYLQIIVRDLKAILKQGFERHVLGYTLYYIMSKGLAHPLSGKLDYCLDDLLPVVEEDILGNVSEQKDEEKFASKMKETRKRMSFDTLKLIAQGVTFKTHALKLLSPVLTHLQRHLTPKVKANLGNMLSHIAAGIELNPTVNQRDLFIFIYGLVEDGICEETHVNEISAVKVVQLRPDGGTTTVVKSRCSHLITEFALGMFHNRLKTKKLDTTEIQLIPMLDPFVKLLIACLNSRFEEISSAALKCMGHLIKLPLPSLETHADKMKLTLMDIAQTSSNATSPIMQSCFKLLTELLQINKVTLSKEELLVLIKFPLFTDLESNPSFIALSLFKAIIRRRLVDPEGLVYKIVADVANLMVNSQEEPMRKRCSQILLQFLLNYQLTQKRMQQHFEHLITNLSYEHASGREAVLEMLRVIIEKFPKSFIDKHSGTLFIHLAYHMANDLDNHVRKLIGTAIQLLISRISSGHLDAILNICLTWYLGEEQHLWSTAAQILGLLVEAMKKGFQKYIGSGSGEWSQERSVLLMMKRIMKSAIGNMMGNEIEVSNQGTVYLWKETYYSLVLFQKILVQFPGLFFQKDVEDIWEAVSEFLMHPHAWIRSISNRLVSLYFQQTLVRGKQVGTCFLTRISRLLKVAVLQCCQLKARVSGDGASEIITFNLVFAICGIYALMGQPECKDTHTFWSTVDAHEQACFIGACQLLDARIARDIAVPIGSILGSENEGGTSYELQHRLVSSLIETMGKIAIQLEDTQMKIVLSSFQLIASKIGQEGCQNFLVQLFMPIYKICEGFTGRIVSDDVKQHAEEVRQSMQETLGSQSFIQTYNKIRNKLNRRRDKRKQEEKVMAVVDPVRNAKRKLKLAEKRKFHKKRKIIGMKMGRWL